MVAPGFDEFAVLRIFDDAVVGLRYRKITVAVGDEDVAIRSDENIRRAVELIGSIAGDARPAQRHQQVAVRSELRNGLVLAVCNPDRSVGSCEQSVRPLEQAGAEAHYQAAGCAEFLNRRDVRAFAGFSAAAIEDPKTGHYLERDELAGLKRLQREPRSAYVFVNERGQPFSRMGIGRMIERAGETAKLPFSVHVHMLRHSTGFALAGKGMDTRRLQHYLGHASITNTVGYTAMSPEPFKDL
jgi:hypothetical protein